MLSSVKQDFCVCLIFVFSANHKKLTSKHPSILMARYTAVARNIKIFCEVFGMDSSTKDTLSSKSYLRYRMSADIWCSMSALCRALIQYQRSSIVQHSTA